MAASAGQKPEDPKLRVARRLGLVPTTQEIVERWLDEAVPAEGGAAALDAGCGRLSQLRPLRPRLSRFVGVDIHAPSKPLTWLDEFAVADLCTDVDAFPPATFDVTLSNFTVEHFADPVAAFRTIGAWLKPGGWLVITTVNRRHPLVDLYLSIPTELRSRVQPIVKKSEADAHPLVGACNTPRLIRRGAPGGGLHGHRDRDHQPPGARLGPDAADVGPGPAGRPGRALDAGPPVDDRGAGAPRRSLTHPQECAAPSSSTRLRPRVGTADRRPRPSASASRPSVIAFIDGAIPATTVARTRP